MKRLKLVNQRDFTTFKTRKAGPHKDRRHKRKLPRCVTKRRAWEVNHE